MNSHNKCISRPPTKQRSWVTRSRLTMSARTSLTISSRRREPRSACLFPHVRESHRRQVGTIQFTVIGYFKSGMSEYDSTHVYVPLRRLQEQRQLIDISGRGAVNQIQIKVRRQAFRSTSLAAKIQNAMDELRHPAFFRVSTWEQKQGPFLGPPSPSSKAS